MSFLAIHRTRHASLATDRPWLDPQEWTACGTAVELLDRLQALNASHAARLQAEIAQAREAGFAAGRSEALRNTADALLQHWRSAAERAAVESRDLRDAVVALSLQVVQRIATGLPPADLVAALALRASEDLVPEQPATVRVHPDVAAAVADKLAGIEVLEVRADATLAPLDCVFETPTGRVLAGLATQLDGVAQALRGAGA